MPVKMFRDDELELATTGGMRAFLMRRMLSLVVGFVCC